MNLSDDVNDFKRIEDDKDVLKLNHLHDIVDKCKMSPHLSSFYMSKIDRFGCGGAVDVINKKQTWKCPFCKTFRTAYNSKIRIHHGVRNPKSIKQLQRLDKKHPERITRRQRRILDLKISDTNYMTMTCLSCKMKTRVQMPLQTHKGKRQTGNNHMPRDHTAISKKRKRTKDLTAGLNIPSHVNQSSAEVDKRDNTKRQKDKQGTPKVPEWLKGLFKTDQGAASKSRTNSSQIQNLESFFSVMS